MSCSKILKPSATNTHNKSSEAIPAECFTAKGMKYPSKFPWENPKCQTPHLGSGTTQPRSANNFISSFFFLSWALMWPSFCLFVWRFFWSSFSLPRGTGEFLGSQVLKAHPPWTNPEVQGIKPSKNFPHSHVMFVHPCLNRLISIPSNKGSYSKAGIPRQIFQGRYSKAGIPSHPYPRAT